MKKLLTITKVMFGILVFLPQLLSAQAPQKMSYQIVIRNTNNLPVTTTTVGMRISILQTSATGTAVYVETQTPSANANGLVSIEIGSGTVVSGTFASINWAAGPYFIKTETDITGGTNYSIISTKQLTSVPYALYAKTSGSAGPQGPIGPTGPTGPAGGSASFSHYIGELYGGGIIVSLWKVSGVEHGLIASLTDIGTGTAWSNVGSTAIGATAQSITDGSANTTAIMAQAGHTTSLAKLCKAHTGGGFTDWYMPAILELKQCTYAAIIINEVLGATNGFKPTTYLSSTEYKLVSPATSVYGTLSYWDQRNSSWSKTTTTYSNYGGAITTRAVRKF